MDYEKEILIIQRDAWKETARFHLSNEQYYHGLLNQIGEMFGEEAYTCDDGSRSTSILCIKLPELVKKLINERST